MDRSTNKHGPRLDDELKKETESLTRGAPVEARAEDERDAEGPADGEYGGGAFASKGLGADPVTARRELSRHLRATMFPADRDALVAEARKESAPAAVIDALRQLPEGEAFATVHEVWAALTSSSAREDPLAHGRRR